MTGPRQLLVQNLTKRSQGGKLNVRMNDHLDLFRNIVLGSKKVFFGRPYATGSKATPQKTQGCEKTVQECASRSVLHVGNHKLGGLQLLLSMGKEV